MMKQEKIFIVVIALFYSCISTVLQAQTEITTLFERGTDGYACFRIPAIVRTEKGTLLAFAEGRKDNCADTGNIDVVLRRSADDGTSWEPLQVVWDAGEDVCGNPVPIVDRRTGRIHLIVCWNRAEDRESQLISGESRDKRHVYTLYSDDDGRTWSAPREITASVNRPEWGWYATGPCHGLQLQAGEHAGRLIVPANHSVVPSATYYAHCFYSDDGGETWTLGGTVEEGGGNECGLVERADGPLMLNMRNYNRTECLGRAYALSRDGGASWTRMDYLPELIEPVCQGSTLNLQREGQNSATLLFSNPASTEKREKMTVKISRDNGQTWCESLPVYDGPAAYSDLVQLTNSRVGLLFEYGTADAYERIGFASISIPTEK